MTNKEYDPESVTLKWVIGRCWQEYEASGQTIESWRAKASRYEEQLEARTKVLASSQPHLGQVILPSGNLAESSDESSI